MIKISDKETGSWTKFANHCVFHPTDAVEDPWGKRILDTMSKDKAVNTVRIYNMLEDIVYYNEDGELSYDFRVNDLRLDYLVEKGFNLMISYAAVPPCISEDVVGSSMSHGATRYKGKMFNTSAPKDYALWEEVCYQYTKHIIDRYGEDTVSKWYLHCFNEPDSPGFFLKNYEHSEGSTIIRAKEYCKLYKSFVDGVTRASENVHIGGPALAWWPEFLRAFLTHIKENDIRIDYIALHHYGTAPRFLNSGERDFSISNWKLQETEHLGIVKECGFGDTEVVYDEWGAASAGFKNLEDCPQLIFRETIRYSAYYVKLVHHLIKEKYKIGKLMICLSGQHEMTTDFSGFRNFFTLNFIRKPIYNAHCLMGKLGNTLLECSGENETLSVIATKRDNSGMAVLVTYCDNEVTEGLEDIKETIAFDNIKGKKVRITRIDRENANPYGEFLKMGIDEPTTKEQIDYLREAGKMKPEEFIAQSDEIELSLSANAVALIEVE